MQFTTKFNGATIESYTYAYDALSRPTTRNSDTFGYNERGEVVFSHRDEYPPSEASPRSGCPSRGENAEDAYAYDGIGNLQIASFNFVTNTYEANNLNQYTSIQNISAPLREIFHRERRIKKTTPTTETTFVYDGWNIVHETVTTANGARTNITEIQYFWEQTFRRRCRFGRLRNMV